MTKITVQVYEDEGGGWRWRLRLGNAKKFAVSGEAFASRGNARRAARRMVELLRNGEAQVVLIEDDG